MQKRNLNGGCRHEPEKARSIRRKKAVESLYMPDSRGNSQIEADENTARNPINKDILLLWWIMFLLFHRPLIEGMGMVFGFLVGADGVFPLVPGTSDRSVMD